MMHVWFFRIKNLDTSLKLLTYMGLQNQQLITFCPTILFLFFWILSYVPYIPVGNFRHK